MARTCIRSVNLTPRGALAARPSCHTLLWRADGVERFADGVERLVMRMDEPLWGCPRRTRQQDGARRCKPRTQARPIRILTSRAGSQVVKSEKRPRTGW